MNIKTKEAIELYNNLEEFIKKDIDLPAQCVWDMEDNSETLKKVVDKFNNMSNKMLQPLRDANAFTALDNGNVKVEKEYVDEFKKVNDELSKFLETDNEIDIKMISKSDLPSTLSVKDIRALRFMVGKDKEPSNK